MRLKFLFFPLMLLISVFIFMGYGWPEVGKIKDSNTKYLQQQSTLASIREKEDAITKISQMAKSGSDTNQAVMDYFPNAEKDERILNDLNSLAVSAGVSLANISIKDAEGGMLPAGAAIDPTAIPDPNAAPATSPDAVTVLPDGTVAPIGNTIKESEVSLQIMGKYEQIKGFAGQVQKMGMTNAIKSMDITKGSGTDADPSVLQANMVVDFSYIAPMKFTDGQIAQAEMTLDDKTVNSLKDGSLIKSSTIDVGTAGRQNPFLP